MKHRVKRLVLVAENTKGKGLRLLANSLSEKVGFNVLRVRPSRVRNRVGVVFNRGIDKITQFKTFKTQRIDSPDFCTVLHDIHGLSSKRIVARKLIYASEGRGIVIFNKEDTPPPAPLYTEYIVKKKEFRVHVFNNQVIDIAEKRKRVGYTGERDNLIRNTANGYVFCRTNIVEPDNLRALALSAVAALGRSQGAVDVIWNEKQDKCYVLEVNSRPGMEGTTVAKYAEAIYQKYLGEING